MAKETEAEQDKKWDAWVKGRHQAVSDGLGAYLSYRFNQFDWAMLLVPGIMLVSVLMLIGGLIGLGIIPWWE